MSETQHTPFHFSPRPNRAHEIRWRPWGAPAFAEAQRVGKPVLLSLSAVWCHWCHVMDETSYSDPEVIRLINDEFVPVRVDNDQRPDVNARYNMGGWPTTAFLTPEGEILAGATYVPPEQMRELLLQVNAHYREHREEVAQKVAELRQRRASIAVTPPGSLTPDIPRTVLRAIIDAYDPVYGGFGEAPKFPHADSIALLLHIYRRSRDPDLLHIARKTLQSMAHSALFDHEWGGFFRYATRRDWSEPHYEKMLEDNAQLLRCFLSLYRITGDENHAAVASGIIQYLEAKLRDHQLGFFYGSQDADEEFYRLPASQRDHRPQPFIDRRCYTAWNALAASAYLEASWSLSRPQLAATALRTLDYLWAHLRAPEGGLYRYYDGQKAAVPGILADQAQAARAFLDAYEVAGDRQHLHRAAELARFIAERFADHAGSGFYDLSDQAEGVGRLAERQRTPQDNAACADVFLRLHHLTREEAFLPLARQALEAFAGVYHNLGQFAASYAHQVDIYLNPPVVVNVVGEPSAAAALHRAALSLDVPARLVQRLDPTGDADRLAALSLPQKPAPAAYACLGATCAEPVTDPQALAAAIAALSGAQGAAQ